MWTRRSGAQPPCTAKDTISKVEVMHRYVFTDTNLFEQYQSITNIDWLTLAGCDFVSLEVPSVTVRELNDHKDGATRGRLKRRAGAALSALRKYSDEGTPAKVRESVHLEFRPREPLIDFGMYHLDPKLNDDRLIASAIELAIEKQLGPESVLVTTGDFGLELKIKSQPLISPLRLPDELRLPNEPDQEEARIRDLEAEILRLRSSVPELCLTFGTGEALTEIALERPLELREEKVQEELAQLRCRFPLLDAVPATPSNVLSWALNTPEMIAQHNSDLAVYYDNVEGYLRAHHDYLNRRRLSSRLTFMLHNKGAAPADDIDIGLHFPDGFLVLGKGGDESEPREPRPPLRPFERLAERMSLPTFRVPDLDLPSRTAQRLADHSAANARLLRIKNTKSYQVDFSVKKLKHTLSEELPPIWIRFRSFKEVRPFGISYRILAANLPKPVEGSLHVKVRVS
jgi:hypothetical protein